MRSWRKLIPLMLGVDLLACQAAAPNVNPLPASAPVEEAVVAQGNTARENKDYVEAMRLYRQVAAIGNATAMNNIGRLYQSGLGVPSDYGEALRWYRLAAERGSAAAMDNIGWLYQYGLGVPPDYGEAMRWYRQAAEQGSAAAMNNMGWLYQNGWGVPKDLRRGYALVSTGSGTRQPRRDQQRRLSLPKGPGGRSRLQRGHALVPPSGRPGQCHGDE
jgi:TPR repeat protein